MRNLSVTPLLALALILGSSALPAYAGDDHDHGDDAPASTGAPVQPRFAASSELFELVGVLNGRQLELYLDRAPDNSPVNGAQLELELGGTRIPVTATGDGSFTATLPAEPPAGELAVSATVVAGEEADLLAGVLDIHAAAHADEARGQPAWQGVAAWGGGALAVLAVLLGLQRTRKARAGGAA